MRTANTRAGVPLKLKILQVLLASSAFITVQWSGSVSAETVPVEVQPTISAVPKVAELPSKGGSTIITGSRLPNTDGIAAAPIAIIDGDEFKLSGNFNPEVLLNDLPQFFPAMTAFINNGGDGTAKLDLRALGSEETLVLVNGRRWIPTDTGEGVDINTIPAFLIDNVQVVTGGGSAVYGSGAVAGVVNFNLRKIDGIEAGAQAAFTEDGGGRRLEAHIAYGTAFASGRGHVSAYAEYLDRRPILNSDRNYLTQLLFDGFDGELAPSGSTAVPQGYFRAIFGGEGTNFDGRAIFASPGVSRPFVFSSGNSLGDLYNFQAVNYAMVPQKRWALGGQAEYEISPSARLYGELSFTENKTTQQLAPANLIAIFDYGPVRIDVNAVAGYLSPSDLAQFEQISLNQGDPGFASFDFRYRTTQVGPRRMNEDREAWHGLAGVTGSLGSLTYDVSYSYGRTTTPTHETGEINITEFYPRVENGSCNVFGADLLSDNCIAAISLPLTNHERVQQHIAQGTISGPVLSLPDAIDPVSFVSGLEWRSLHGDFDVDPNNGISTSSQPSPLHGGYNVEEAFGELKAPLVQNERFYRLELDAGWRFSHYSLSNVHSTWSWYFGGELAPSSAIAFRAQYQRAFRAPRLSELFQQNLISYPIAVDPCSFEGFDMSDSVRNVCVATGVPADIVFNYDAPFQTATLVGGNPKLHEERANTWTLGAVLRPKILPRLTLTADYYHIDLESTVGGIPAEAILEGCYFVVQNAESPLCQSISRNPDTGEIIQIDGRIRNTGNKKTDGVDFLLDFNQPIAAALFGHGHSVLNFQILAGWLNKSNFEPVEGLSGVFHCSGKFGLNCGDPRPRWSWVSRLSWVDGPLTTSIRWRHTGKVKDDDQFRDFVVERIGAYNLFDLGFAVHLANAYSLHFGINNLFDKRPPILGDNAAFSGNTYPSTYDILGRDYFVSVDATF